MMKWVLVKNKIQTHNGESTLFNERLLSSRKDEQLSGQHALQSPKTTKAGMHLPCSNGQHFCRPEGSHKYLQASVSETSVMDLTECTRPQNSTYGDRLGRPTRSSLLRTKHQLLSMSRSFHTMPTETQGSSEPSARRSCEQSEELQQLSASLGETVHSFLVGARYNRSSLDSQALQKYGLYISRTQPPVSFLIQCQRDHLKKQEEKHDLHVSNINECAQKSRFEDNGSSRKETSIFSQHVQETDGNCNKGSSNNCVSGPTNQNRNNYVKPIKSSVF
ncbi:uncharacterized protein [Pleurodeles waltl]|uniref:uncharacterized protein isoform X2 n=1 Tax=Pleurodeles waltl TaxID=8319 RepID=UPI003709B528